MQKINLLIKIKFLLKNNKNILKNRNTCVIVKNKYRGDFSMKEKRLEQYVKWLLDFMYYSGCLVCITIPVIFRYMGKWYSVFQTHFIEMCILFFIAGAFAVLIIEELRKMFQTVLEENCFIEQNVTSLKKMGCYSIAASIATTIRLFYTITPSTVVIILIFFIAGLFSFVLSKVFQQAVKYKEENDLTI